MTSRSDTTNSQSRASRDQYSIFNKKGIQLIKKGRGETFVPSTTFIPAVIWYPCYLQRGFPVSAGGVVISAAGIDVAGPT